MKPVGVFCFPGTQCEQDVKQVLQGLGFSVTFISYRERFSYRDYSAFILPGGFSYGDYLRSGALAARAPVMQDIRVAAQEGYPVLGICNGFQILCESGLLPGVLQVNENLRFINKWVDLSLQNVCSSWGSELIKKVRIPIAHKEGRFYASKEQMRKLTDQGQIWLTYKDNPNGSVGDVAGVMGEKKHVAGLMPHPERAVRKWMGGTDGISFFKTFLEFA